MGTETQTNIPQSVPSSVAVKLRKVMIDKFDSCSKQWNRWKKQFELQVNANDINKEYWVKLASYNLDDHAYRAYECNNG